MIFRAKDHETKEIGGTCARRETPLTRPGGLTQMAANITTLAPGQRSSERHWHANEDEMLVMLEGEAVVVENDGEHVIGPGDVCLWPAGVPNAHRVLNRSDRDVRYLVVGSDPSVDLVFYPDTGQTLHYVPPRWWLEDSGGQVIDEGKT